MAAELFPESTTQGIPASLITAKGAMIAGSGAGLASTTLAQQESQTPTYHAADPNGLVWENPMVGQRLLALNANPGLATAANFGYPAAPTLTATAANSDEADGPWVQHTTGATNPSHSGVVPAAFVYARPGWMPDTEWVIKTGATITTYRIVCGLVSATTDGATIPTNIHGAYFKFETNGAVTTWQVCTAAGAAPTVAIGASPVIVAANTRYKLRIEFVGTPGGNPSSVRFLINDVLLHTATATLPAANQTMSPICRVSTLTAQARAFKWSRIYMACPI